MSNLWPVVWIGAGAFGIGFVDRLAALRERIQRREAIVTFASSFKSYVESDFERGQTYQWLLMNANEVESILGGYAIMHWKPPMHPPGSYIPTLAITHGLSELSDDRRYLRSSDGFWVRMIEDTVVRYLGVVESEIRKAQKEIRSPSAWLRGGIHFMAMAPFLLLRWLNLLSVSRVRAIEENYFTKLLQAVIFFGGVAAAVIQSLDAWDKVAKLISR